MSIIAPSIFVGEITIPQSTNYFENGGNLQSFIDDYENEFLLKLFGATFYNEFMVGLGPPATDIKWTDLANNVVLKKMISYYVYVKWKIDETTQSFGISEGKPKAENASVTNSVDKQVKIWNKLVDLVRGFDLNTTAYPNFVKRHIYVCGCWYTSCCHKKEPDIYYYDNTLGF